MKFHLACIGILAAGILAMPPKAYAGNRFKVPGQLIIQVSDDFTENDLEDLLERHNALQLDNIDQINLRVLQVPENAHDASLRSLRKHRKVLFAEEDYLLEPELAANDPSFTAQWHLTKIETPAAWDYTTGKSTVKVAILDSGVDANHPDLASRVIPGWNFFDSNSNTADVYGHGTAVAGTAAASGNNALGVSGVGWSFSIMPLRVTDVNGNAFESMIAKALTYAADNGARVANISFRASGSSTVKSAAQYFQNKGGVVVIASGNNATFDSTADNPYALTVSATDAYDALATWSNTGNNIDLAAPGANILTTSRGAEYSTWSGTSFSAPVVAGAAALVLSANGSLTGVQVADLLKKTTDDLGTAGWDTKFGTGRLNARRAVQAALGITSSPPPVQTSADAVAPVVSISSPAEGASFRAGSKISVSIKATDNVGVAKVALYADGKLVGTSTKSPYSISWSSTGYAKGAHILKAYAYDAAGNAGNSPDVIVYLK